MDKYLARVFRALIVTTLGVGGGCALLVFIIVLMLKHDQHALQFGINAGLVIGFLASIFLVVICSLIDLTAHLFLAKGLYEEIWELEQTRDLVAAGTAKEIVQASRQALLTVPNVKNVIDDPDSGTTKASTGASWRSPGEDIEVSIESLDEQTFKIKCVSKPRSQGAVFDYGKNYENVEVWQQNVHKLLKSGATPA